MSHSSDDSLAYLLDVVLQLNRSVPIIQLILGTFGNVMNILVFRRRSLRTNPCSLYFLASSINNLFVLYVALLTRLLSSGWKIDPSNMHSALCKLRIFFVYSSLCLIQWFVVLASLDRWFSSCHTVRYRHLSNLRFAKRSIFLTVVIVAVAHLHTLVWWRVDYIDAQLYCNIFYPRYEITFQVFFLTFSCLLPPACMALFGLLTIFNVRKLRRQIVPQNIDQRHQRARSKDGQLISMLLFQVLITMFCTAPFATVNLFNMITNQDTSIIYSVYIQALFESLCRLILYLNPMIGFYIYTLSSRTFRLELRALLRHGLELFTDTIHKLIRKEAEQQQTLPTISSQPAKNVNNRLQTNPTWLNIDIQVDRTAPFKKRSRVLFVLFFYSLPSTLHYFSSKFCEYFPEDVDLICSRNCTQTISKSTLLAHHRTRFALF